MTDHSALIERLEAAKRSTMLGGETCFVPVPLVDEVAAALRDLTEWRDILSAPSGWILGAWSDATPPVYGVVMWDGDDWRESDDVVSAPTNWLPLPSAPNQAKSEQ